jgi:multimeric flavodoxin WrbA
VTASADEQLVILHDEKVGLMKIGIVNGNPGGMRNGLDEYLERLGEVATVRGHKVKLFVLRDMDIKDCTGCTMCWVQTPGECVFEDDTPLLHRAFVHADVWVCASPIIMGHISSLLKRSHDKVLPLVVPYFKVYGGEMHHPLRHDRSPDLAVIADRNGADDEDLRIVERSYRRFSVNIHSRLRYFATMDRPVEEVVDALASAERLPQR